MEQYTRSLPSWISSLSNWKRLRCRDFKFSRRRVWCSELSSGIYCRVKLLSTDDSEVRAASIIRDEWAKHERSGFI
jgi:hypothetical protein